MIDVGLILTSIITRIMSYICGEPPIFHMVYGAVFFVNAAAVSTLQVAGIGVRAFQSLSYNRSAQYPG